MFVVEEDFRVQRRLPLIDQMLGNERSQLLYFTDQATEYVASQLRMHYDTEWELTRSGSDRNGLLVRWVVVVATYYAAQKVMPDRIPQEMANEYADVREDLAAVRSGKTQLSLRKRETPTGPSADILSGSAFGQSPNTY
jgi:hypothetical protein